MQAEYGTDIALTAQLELEQPLAPFLPVLPFSNPSFGHFWRRWQIFLSVDPLQGGVRGSGTA
jgi:hypothetical protein